MSGRLIPANPGFNALGWALRDDGSLLTIRTPIIAWQIDCPGELEMLTATMECWPLAYGNEGGDFLTGLQFPDSRVYSEAAGSCEHFADLETAEAAVLASLREGKP